MRMWLKQSTLVFITVAAMVTLGQDPVTLDDGEKKTVRLAIGSPLSLKCKLKTDGLERFWIAFYFNPSGSSFNNTHSLPKRMYSKSSNTSTMGQDDGQETETLLHLTSNAVDKFSGWYFCRVTANIPRFCIMNSSGTEVIISTGSPAEHFQLIKWWQWVAVGVSAFVLIILLITSCLLRRRCIRIREDPVYINTHNVNKQPSPRPRPDNLKVGSSTPTLRNLGHSRGSEEGKQRQCLAAPSARKL